MALFRKRERFERSDVPRPSQYSTVIGIVVIVIVFAACALTFFAVKNRVELESNLGDSDLEDAVSEQSSSLASADGVDCTLLLVASSLDDTGATLVSARILALNAATSQATLINLPLEAQVSSGESMLTVAECFSSNGCAGTVAPLADSCGVKVSNVIVSTSDVLDEVAAVSGSDAATLVSSASGLIGSMKTSLDTEGLLSLAHSLDSMGVANIAGLDVSLAAELAYDEEGNPYETGNQVVDSDTVVSAVSALATPTEEGVAEEAAE